MSGQAYRQMALAEMAQSSTFYGGTDMERARRLALLPEEDEDNFDEQAERGGKKLSIEQILVLSKSNLLQSNFHNMLYTIAVP